MVADGGVRAAAEIGCALTELGPISERSPTTFPAGSVMREEEQLALPELWRTEAFNLVTKPLGWLNVTMLLRRSGRTARPPAYMAQ
jgi:hypothetical protein